MQIYIDLHRHAAVRAKLLDHPNVALRLLLAHAITGSYLWIVRADPQRTDKAAIAASVENSPSEGTFREKRREALALLGIDHDEPTLVSGGSVGTVELFDRLLSLTDEDVMAILTLVMGETLAVGGAAVDAAGTRVDLDMADVWRADDAFFDLIRSKELLIAIVAAVAGPEVAAANAGEKGKVLKGIICDCLDGSNGRTKVDRWVPSCIQCPQSASM